MAAFRVVFVPVHAAEDDRSAVQEQGAIPDFDAAEADSGGDRLPDAAVRAPERQDEAVEVRRLRRPRADRKTSGAGARLGLAAGRDGDGDRAGLAPEGAFVRVQQGDFEPMPAGVAETPVRQRGGEFEDAFSVVVEIGPDREIPEEGRRAGQQRDLAVDAADPPEVLALEVAAVAPAEDGNGHGVRAGAHPVGDPELGGSPAALAVAHEGAVHPHEECGIDAVESQEDLAPLQASGRSKSRL